jgi:hypothetical protein
MAAPARAGVPPLPDPVQDVVDTVDDVTGSDDPIGDAIDAVDDAVGDVTGTEDPIEDTIDDVTATVDDVVEDAGETAEDVVDRVDDTAEDVVDRVDDATGGTIGDVIGGGQGGGSGNGGQPGNGGGSGGGPAGGPFGNSFSPDGRALPRRGPGAPDDPARDSFGARAPALTAGESAEAPSPGSEPGLGERLREAALDATKKLALPLALTLVVLGYLIAQYWADRRDPKLLLAPVDADHDLLSFQ